MARDRGAGPAPSPSQRRERRYARPRGLMLTIAAPSVARVIRVAQRHGLPVAELWALAGLGANDPVPPTVRVPTDVLFGVFAAIMHGLADSAFPIACARATTIDQLGALGLAIKTARTGREAHALLAQHHSYWADSSTWHLDEHAGEVRMEFRRDGPRTLGMRAANEAAVAEWLHGARGLVGQELTPMAAHFRHRAPSQTGLHREFFACPLVFGSDFDGLVLTPALFDVPVPTADAPLSSLLCGFLGNQQAPETDGVEGKLQTAVAAALVHGVPLMPCMAKSLGMSPRTLARRLADVGTTFQKLVDETRHALALDLLKGSRHGIAQVAHLLGYSEPSAFSRAFKRWTGRSPAAYRRAPV